jgi:hypothetical protein
MAVYSVSKIGSSLKFERWRIHRIFKNSVKTKKIVRNEVEPWKEQEKIKNPKFGQFDRIIDRFDRIIDRFFKNFGIFKKWFGPLRRFE